MTPRPGTPRSAILVADDDPINRMVMVNMLEEAGYDIIEAGDGVEAAEMALEQRPKLVLMDIAMPRMDGVAAAKLIRSQQPEQRTPIVAVTAHASLSQRESCTAAGFDGFITKPVRMANLIETVGWFMAGPSGSPA